ncbi:MAG: hypothetical protein CME13_20145 [Gemmatimonadetes bacterium]|nr:hypothetical protein [Gemmatimonadota bacterium]HCV22562.1 hypothetical protein [Candidatus Latescibacterota bacterium]
MIRCYRACLHALLFLSWMSLPVLAQEKASSPWTHQLVGDVTANQVALKDWAAGGDDASA